MKIGPVRPDGHGDVLPVQVQDGLGLGASGPRRREACTPMNETGALKPCQRHGLIDDAVLDDRRQDAPDVQVAGADHRAVGGAVDVSHLDDGARLADLDDQRRVAAVAAVLPIVGAVPPQFLARLGVEGQQRHVGRVDQLAVDQVRRDVVAVLQRAERTAVVPAPHPLAVEVEAGDDVGARPLHSAAAGPVDVLAVAQRHGVAGGDFVAVHRRVLLAVDLGEGVVDGPLGVGLGLERLVQFGLLVRGEARRRDGRVDRGDRLVVQRVEPGRQRLDLLLDLRIGRRARRPSWRRRACCSAATGSCRSSCRGTAGRVMPEPT